MRKQAQTRLSPEQLQRRSEIGEERRMLTRAKILSAAYKLFAMRGADVSTIDDVIEAAGVARGSFYNHFQTRDDVFKAVADDIATGINRMVMPLLSNEPDPAVRAALSFRIFIHFAVSDESRGWILLRTMPLTGLANAQMRERVEQEFAQGVEAGRFRAVSPTILADLAFGMLMMTIRRAVTTKCDDDHIAEAAETLLMALGVKTSEARKIARQAIDFDALSRLLAETTARA